MTEWKIGYFVKETSDICPDKGIKKLFSSLADKMTFPHKTYMNAGVLRAEIAEKKSIFNTTRSSSCTLYNGSEEVGTYINNGINICRGRNVQKIAEQYCKTGNPHF